mgnify:CR=1 FL=1
MNFVNLFAAVVAAVAAAAVTAVVAAAVAAVAQAGRGGGEGVINYICAEIPQNNQNITFDESLHGCPNE